MAFIKFTFSNQNHKIYPSSWIKIKEALITHTIDVLFRRDFIVNNQLMNCFIKFGNMGDLVYSRKRCPASRTC